jgi:hypothetical protein
MKFTLPTIAAVLSLASTASTWTLDLHGTGRSIHARGRNSSGCVNIDIVPSLNINLASYSPATVGVPKLTDTFKLFTLRNCRRLNYQNGGGNFTLEPPRETRSYRVD